MLKIWPCSDLHFRNLQDVDDFMEKVPRYADVVVIAGDVANGSKDVVRFMRHWLQAESMRQRPVIMVLGNHDYWRDVDMAMSFYAVSKLEGEFPFFHLLHRRNPVTIEDVTFIGDTLWTDMELFDDRHTTANVFHNDWSDHFMINYQFPNIRFPAYDWIAEFKDTLSQIMFQVEEAHLEERKIVVVTHHLPDPDSCDKRFAEDNEMNPFYASKDIIKHMNPLPDIWIHGHTHSPSDYVKEGVRVVCNPRGYQTERYSEQPLEINSNLLEI